VNDDDESRSAADSDPAHRVEDRCLQRDSATATGGGTGIAKISEMPEMLFMTDDATVALVLFTRPDLPKSPAPEIE